MDMPTCQREPNASCIECFLIQFLPEITGPFQALIILSKLSTVVAAYQTSINNITLSTSDIFNQFSNCSQSVLQPILTDVLTELFITIGVVAALMVAVGLIILIVLWNNTFGISAGQSSFGLIAIIFVIFLGFIAALFLILSGTKYVIRQQVDNTIDQFKSCVNTAATQLEELADLNEAAINTAICAYPASA